MTLLDTKAQQNVRLALANYRMPSQEIKTSIILMAESNLDLENPASSRNLDPSDGPRATLHEYDHPVGV